MGQWVRELAQAWGPGFDSIKKPWVAVCACYLQFCRGRGPKRKAGLCSLPASLQGCEWAPWAGHAQSTNTHIEHMIELMEAIGGRKYIRYWVSCVRYGRLVAMPEERQVGIDVQVVSPQEESLWLANLGSARPWNYRSQNTFCFCCSFTAMGVGRSPLPRCVVFISWRHSGLLGIFICGLSRRWFFPKLYYLIGNKNGSLCRVLMNKNKQGNVTQPGPGSFT